MTTSFGIDFDDSFGPLPDGFEIGFAWAVVEIGSFRERIAIPIEYWRRTEYYAQWHAACDRLLSHNAVSVFLVDVRGDWSAMDKSFAWVAYVEDPIVHVQNVLLWPWRRPRAGFQNAHLAAPRRTTRSREHGTKGMPVSEWRTSLESIEKYSSELEARLRNGPRE
jgi:hypothetical protein